MSSTDDEHSAPVEKRRASDRLQALISQGIGSAPEPKALRRELGLEPDSEDREVARALVRALDQRTLGGLRMDRHNRHDQRQSLRPTPVPPADISFLGRLGAGQTDGSVVVGRLDDLRTLIAVLRAGTLRQRRAAVQRLAERLSEDKKSAPGDQVRAATDALVNLRDIELAYERVHALARLGGSVGRRARDDLNATRSLADRLEREVVRFWDAEVGREPVAALSGDRRALLLVRARDLPEIVMAHICAIIEGADGFSDDADQLALLTSLRHAADPRLVPALVAALEGAQSERVAAAAHALARIDDPRVHPRLLGQYERSVVDTQRCVLAGALGVVGDCRGVSYVRRLLATEDHAQLLLALEALESLGGPEDVEQLQTVLERGDPTLRVAAVRALGRSADERGLRLLENLRDQTQMGGLWAEIEDADASIRARLELRGEVAPSFRPADPALAPQRAELIDTRAGARWRARWHYLVGQTWLAFGFLDRAVARLDLAAQQRPSWPAPLLLIAMTYARRNRYARALAAFRRVIEADRRKVEGQTATAGTAALVFLRRAEEVEREGRLDIARGLLEEGLALDLRRAPGALRFELSRHLEALRRAQNDPRVEGGGRTGSALA